MKNQIESRMQNEAAYFINHKLPSLNEYIDAERTNRYNAASLKKKFTKICTTYALQIKGKINPYRCYNLKISWVVTNNRSDPDNIYFAVKFILDGLVNSGVIKGDGRKNISDISHSITTGKEYSVKVEIFTK